MNDPYPPAGTFDPRAFRNALGQFATGVTIITAKGLDGQYVGLTANSFNSVSLDPPLILWSLSLYSPSLAVFQGCTHYAVNLLAHDQVELSNRFARPASDKFSGLAFEEGAGGAPLLPGCCGHFECRNEAHHPGGDHIIFVGLVERFTRHDRTPLLFHGGRYCTVADLP